MKYAQVEGIRHAAQPGRTGNCPVCGSAVIAKCGETRIWHWAHKGKRTCDPWWENETEWHRNWKDRFPMDWQEKIHWAENREKHIADVKTDQGWVIEFQHSKLDGNERRARENFYGNNLIWVVDGLRRKRDKAQFQGAWDSRLLVRENPSAWHVWLSECALLREWASSRAPVFIDFGADELWCLAPGTRDGMATIYPGPKTNFVKAHREGKYGFQPKTIVRLPMRASLPKISLPGFERYMARRARWRRRF